MNLSLPGMILVFAGASGSGKSTLARELFGRIEGLVSLPSHTTRERRASDKEGEYVYLAPEEFEAKREEWLWEIEVHGTKRGTLRSVVQDAVSASHPWISILTPNTVPLLFQAVLPGRLVPFYVLSPAENILRKRLQARGDSLQDVDRRIQECRTWDTEAKASGLPYFFISNAGEVEEAVQEVMKILEKMQAG